MPSGSSEQALPNTDPTTNRLYGTGVVYDANGNLNYSGTGAPYAGYDAENRMVAVNSLSLTYDPQNHRVAETSSSNFSQLYFFAPNGQLLSIASVSLSSGQPSSVQILGNRIYLGSMVIGTQTPANQTYGNVGFALNNVGSYSDTYPYGTVIRGSAGGGPTPTFATYTADLTGFYYANQRWYSSAFGRFETADPGASAASTQRDPASWNEYSYARSEPVGRSDESGLSDQFGNPAYCDAYPRDPCCAEPLRINPVYPIGPVFTWSLDVGYTPTVNLGGGKNSYDHLFIWLHPTNDLNIDDGVVYDGGPTGNCNWLFQCGTTTAWFSQFGHYKELQNPYFVDFFSEQLGNYGNFSAGQIESKLNLGTLAIAGANDAYGPFTGPNSNSVVFYELQSIGIPAPIHSSTLSILGAVGVLNFKFNGQTQIFTGWGQNLLP